MSKFYNKNLIHLNSSHKRGKRGSILEGSSRSGKTFSGIDFIVTLCTFYDNLVINIIKETYNSFKTTLYDDFNKRLPQFNIVSPFADKQEVSSFQIFTSKINLMGADKPSKFHGASCDYFWVNEIMDIQQSIFDQQEQRCRKYWWADYNPKFTQHWVFDRLCKRPDVTFLKTTFQDNPYISTPERNKLLSYEPTAENITNGTADDFMWKVYGLGERAALKGQIFANVNWIDKFPEGMYHVYGLDFGFTNDPTALVKVAQTEKDIYAELLCYEPIDSAFVLSEYLQKIGLQRFVPINADSSDRYNDIEMVRELKDLGWSNIKKVDKGKGIKYRIGLMKTKRINIVHNINAKREQENYKWREINGILINEPTDSFNHFWDAFGYGYLMLNNRILPPMQ